MRTHRAVLAIARVEFSETKLLVNRRRLNTDGGLTADIHRLSLKDINVDGVNPRADKASHRDKHSLVKGLRAANSLEVSCDSSGHRREGSAARDSRDDESAANFSVTAETTETEGENGCEASGFPAEDETEHGNGYISRGLRGRKNENEAPATQGSQ